MVIKRDYSHRYQIMKKLSILLLKRTNEDHSGRLQLSHRNLSFNNKIGMKVWTRDFEQCHDVRRDCHI